MKDFHRRIVQRMQFLGLSQSELARQVGVKQPSINSLIRGEIDKPRFIIELAKSLMTTPDWLLTGEGPEEKYAGGTGLAEEGGDFAGSPARDPLLDWMHGKLYEKWYNGACRDKVPYPEVPAIVAVLYHRVKAEQPQPAYADIEKRLDEALAVLASAAEGK
jgi:transcriptional regulator with XRE-family HTH domain